MNLGVLTSGGDSPGMNAAIRSVVRVAIAEKSRVFGFIEGYRGLVDKEFTEMTSQMVSEIIDRGGTILRTSRFKVFLDQKIQLKAVANLNSLKIDALIVIGGEGSMKGASCLQKLGTSAIGIPASIDNDIYGTDLAIGFDSALNTVIDVLGKLRDTASAHERIFVIEVMGRHSGAIALGSGLAGGADYVCLPGMAAADAIHIKQINKLVEHRSEQGKTHTLIIVAEGAGSAGDVAEAIKTATKLEVRVSVLGHIQRGGSPSAMDRLLASQFGAHAVDLAIRGKSGVMVGWNEGRVNSISLEETCSKEIMPNEALYRLVKILA